MYKYTIRKEVLELYRKNKSKYSWHDFIHNRYPLELYDADRNHYLSWMLAWYFPQGFVYYSLERRKCLTIKGYKVVINPQLFLEEQL